MPSKEAPPPDHELSKHVKLFDLNYESQVDQRELHDARGDGQESSRDPLILTSEKDISDLFRDFDIIETDEVRGIINVEKESEETRF